ncbi:MAG: L-rhamnose isomerase [Promethearchaeota archaeon]
MDDEHIKLFFAQSDIEKEYSYAKKHYSILGVDTDKALEKLASIPISIHCWQGDDVVGFENAGAHNLEGSGLQVTGNFPGRARNVEELRQDYEKIFELVPGKHRINLHAIYGEFGDKFVDRDKIEPEHFDGWIEWGKEHNVGIDFNATLFNHPKAATGFTLTHPDKEVRDFWIEHVKKCREIGAYIGKKLNDTCIHNLWIPDGMKDLPANRFKYRKTLKDSLDKIYSKKYDKKYLLDAVEGKLFGIGTEAFTVGSYDFYYGYTLKNDLLLTLDMGHFHPTESVADKISSLLPVFDQLLIHVSRGVRWDSDHVVILNDDVVSLAEEIIRSNALDRIHIALDFFDASINRLGAWVIGIRSVLKALLIALLEPIEYLENYEDSGDYFRRLATYELSKSFPWSSVWNYYCLKNEVPFGKTWIEIIKKYEKDVLSKRK